MSIARNIIAVILGYVIFAVSAVLLFQLSKIDPHANPSTGVIIVTLVFGFVFSFIGGLLTQLISKPHSLTINYVLAAIMTGFAAFSWFKSPGNHFSQIAAIFLFAPASILGGFTFLRKKPG